MVHQSDSEIWKMDRFNFAIAIVLAGLGGYGFGALSVPVSGTASVASPAPSVAVQPAAPAAPAPKQVAAVAKPAPAKPAPTPKAPPKKPVELPPPPNLEGSLLPNLPRMGPVDAPVVVLVVSDFQCPVCKRAGAPMKEITEELSGDVVLYFVQNPLKMHRKALGAAKASAAAHMQGRFWEYHDILFDNPRLLDVPDLANHAQRMGLDMTKYQLDSQNADQEKLILNQRSLVESLGARGTPAFFINGKKSVGWGSKLGIKRQIEREITSTKALISGGKSVKDAYEARVRQNSDQANVYLSGFSR